jgi:hypothetical protein
LEEEHEIADDCENPDCDGCTGGNLKRLAIDEAAPKEYAHKCAGKEDKCDPQSSATPESSSDFRAD